MRVGFLHLTSLLSLSAFGLLADFVKLTKSMEKNQTFLVADHA